MKKSLQKRTKVIEEVDESQFWLEILEERELCPPSFNTGTTMAQNRSE